MTETTATVVEELRAAHAKILGLLTDPELTEGPWLSLNHGDRLVRDQPGDEDNTPIYVIDEPMGNGANSHWIELMNPAIGPHIAELLHEAIKHRDSCETAAFAAWPLDPAKRNEFADKQTPAPVLAIARLINDRP